ncbi:peptide ABC transporter substrate-binding protein [Alicyclobacillus acidoterrestris]|nr:peptide ABC transporter substrate-binding protein [Alicyclobacillus acidoterrestris]
MEMRKEKKSAMVVVVGMGVIASIISGCGTAAPKQSSTGATNASSASDASIDKNATIQIDEADDFAHLDPALAYDYGSDEAVYQFYDQLVTYATNSTKIVPDLASSWTVSKDGLKYTFHIRKGVTFWNGDPVTAQSFIDEFQRVLNPKVASPGEGFIDPILQGSTAYFKGQAKSISGLSAPDPYTLEITLTKPQAYFLEVLAMPFFSAVDQSYIDKIGNTQFDHHPMGTGAFEMKSYKMGNEMVMTKNPNYFKKGEPKVQEVDISINKNEQLSALKFQQGQESFLGWNQDIASQAFISMKNNPKFKNDFQSEKLVATYYLALNSKPTGPIQNKLVRQAINMAIDKQRLVSLQNGRAAAANQILPPAMPGYETKLPSDVDYQYNPTKAKQLLKEAGYPNGFSTSLMCPSDQTTRSLVQSIQEDLQKIGIKVSIHPIASASYEADAESMKYPMVYTAWFQDFPDPSDFLNTLLNGNEIPLNNWSNYNNQTVNQELAQAAVMPQGQARLDLYDKIQNQILADAPWVPLFTPIRYAVVQPYVKGFSMSPVLMDPLQNVYVVKH